MVQWSGLHASTPEGLGSIPSWETKMWRPKKKSKKIPQAKKFKVSNFYIKTGSVLSEQYWNSKQKGKSVILVQIAILEPARRVGSLSPRAEELVTSSHAPSR